MNNYHLVVLHFPIALLMLYAGIEIISIRKLRELPYLFYVKAVLVIVGAISAIVTRQTGKMIEHEYEFVKQVVEKHELFANITTILFSFLALLYVIAWIRTAGEWKFLEHKSIHWLWKILVKVQVVFYRRPILVVVALSGLLAVTITGALGGTIANGPNTDPLAHFIYFLFFKE